VGPPIKNQGPSNQVDRLQAVGYYKIMNEIISVEQTKMQGAWCILGSVGNSQLYFFYTKNQAIKQHKKYMRELKRNVKERS